MKNFPYILRSELVFTIPDINLTARFNPEAKSTFAYSYINVEEGHSNVYNITLHLDLGLGYDFRKQTTESGYNK